jgi:hypothetical protein
VKIPGINFQEALWQLTWRKVSHYPRIEVNDLLIEFFTLLLPHLTNPPPELRLGNSNLKEQTATSINGITFKLTETMTCPPKTDPFAMLGFGSKT